MVWVADVGHEHVPEHVTVARPYVTVLLTVEELLPVEEPALEDELLLEQGPPAGPVNPALHLQADWEVLPASEIELAEQFVQCPSPVVTLYCPAGHAVQVPPFVPV